jgi:hypothetical protein
MKTCKKMSKPSKISNVQSRLFQSRLSQQLNPKHPLVLLTHSIDWAGLELD